MIARSGSLGLRNWSEGIVIQESLHLSQSGFERTRNVAGGGLLMFGAARMLGDLIVPGMGMLTGALAGFICAGLAGDAMDKRYREEALAKMERVLREILQAVKNKAIQDFNRIATERERAIRDLFQAAAKGTREEYERQIAQIRERGTQTKESLRESAATRATVLTTLNTLTSQIQSISREPVPS